jgi:hypothetical protein
MKRTLLKRGTKQLKRTVFKSKPIVKRSKLASTAVKLKKTTKTTAQLKKELDRVFSIYIRQKYPKECYTCFKTEITLQCGHFISRQYLATRWDENNCRPQCVGCNIYGNGKPLDFEERLKSELGDGFVEVMKLSRHHSLKLNRQWYLAEIEKYKNKII